MAKIFAPLLAFNRGIVSPKAIARIDVERIKLSAQIMTNFMPKTQGCMYLRTGSGYLGSSYNNLAANWIDFVAATTDTALLELTDQKMRVWINDALLTRPSVATTISNGSFATNTNWTDASTNGGVPTYGGSGLTLNATNRGGLAKVTRTIAVAAPDQNVEHGLHIVVARGPVTFRCGSTAGGDEYVTETSLGSGVHSLAFTPGANFYLQFQSALDINRIVTSIAVEAAGAVEIAAPWLSADLDKIRSTQSADVVFVAADGYQQQRIERRGTGRSWSVIKYVADDGPFFATRSAAVKLKVGATSGNTTLTSDLAFFKSTHVGAIFRLFSGGYNITSKLGAENTHSDPIRVTGIYSASGVYNDRNFTYSIAGTWAGTVRVRRSYDAADSGFKDFGSGSTVNVGATNLSDSNDNAIVYYRLEIKTGEYTSGAATVNLTYDGGGDFGICRVVNYNSPTSVDIEVLKPFTQLTYTDDWREGYWSDYRGWPSNVSLYEGRLWFAGKGRWHGSVSDSYSSFDDTVIGDKAPLNRSLGEGPVDTINFMLPLQQLILGTAGAEITLRSSSLDEPLTVTNSVAKTISTIGSAMIKGAMIDKRGVYVDRAGQRVWELTYDTMYYNYASKELTLLSPDVMYPGVASIAVQRHPDTRIHYVLTDGTVAILTYEPENQVACFSKYETDGNVERAVVLPGSGEDAVYYHVNRTIGGVTKRFLERFALETEIIGGAIHKQADCFVVYSGASSTSITVASHLEGKSVTVWNAAIPVTNIFDGTVTHGDCEQNADGTIKTFVVTGGVVSGLSIATTSAVVGLAFTAQYESTKLAYAAQLGTALTQPKRINYLGLIMATTHMRGLRFGQSFDVMDGLPLDYKGETINEGAIYDEFDEPSVELPGEWNTDARLCLQASAPRPCTLLAAVVGMQTNEKA